MHRLLVLILTTGTLSLGCSDRAPQSADAVAPSGSVSTPAAIESLSPSLKEQSVVGLLSRPITPMKLFRRITAGEAPLILDVRTEQEYRDGHIPGAINIPHDELSDRLSELALAKSDEVVVHCKSGRRAALATEVLTAAELTNVRELEGHMNAWKESGLAENE